jgi:hypothetical protein
LLWPSTVENEYVVSGQELLYFTLLHCFVRPNFMLQINIQAPVFTYPDHSGSPESLNVFPDGLLSDAINNVRRELDR